MIAPYIAPLLLPLLCTVIFAKWLYPHKITVLEFMLTSLGSCTITVITLYCIMQAGLMDTEILNGEVEDKGQQMVSCEHDYEVCSGSGDKRSCTTHYEHAYDYDWLVQTSVGIITIDREDDQGFYEPKRWTDVIIGEPASVPHYYENYLKANPDSLFNYDENLLKHYLPLVPNYPEVYDYYRVNRVLIVGESKLRDATRGWNDYLNNVLRRLGKELQANIVVLVTDQPHDLFLATKYAWSGGKKNDIILGFGIQENQVVWFDSTSFMDGFENSAMHATLRATALDRELDIKVLTNSMKIIQSLFDRHPMESERAQMSAYVASWWMLIVAMLVGLLSSFGLSYYFSRNNDGAFRLKMFGKTF